MTFQKIYDKLRADGYAACKVLLVSFEEENISGIKITCSPFLLNDVMHELWLWLPSEYSVTKLDEQTIIINKRNHDRNNRI